MAHIVEIKIAHQIANVGDTFSLMNKNFVAVPVYGNNMDERHPYCKGCYFRGKDECVDAPLCSEHEVIFVEQGTENEHGVQTKD